MKASVTEFRPSLPEHVELRIESSVGGTRRLEDANDLFTVTVGEMGQHVAVSNVPILGVQWQISGGNPVANYIVNPTLGQVVPVTPADLVVNPLTFAFTTAGTYVVGVTIWTAYGPGFVSNTFVVTAPQVNYFESETSQVGIQTMQNTPWIMFGSPQGSGGRPGIIMKAVVFGQQSTPGFVGILQLVINQRTGVITSYNPVHNSQNGIPALDVGPGGAYVFYQNVIEDLPVGGNAHVMVDDGPGAQLAPPLTLVSIGDQEPGPESYQAFLMFCAASPGAIWVPLSVLNWNWEGYAELQSDGTWSPVQEPGNAVNPSGVATSQFPTWTVNTTTGFWVAGPGAAAQRSA